MSPSVIHHRYSFSSIFPPHLLPPPTSTDVTPPRGTGSNDSNINIVSLIRHLVGAFSAALRG